MEITKTIYVICEGKSEEVYLKTLNRYLNQKEYLFTFLSVSCNQKDGHFVNLKKRWKECLKNNNKTFRYWRKESNILFLVDWDLFERNEKDCYTLYSQEKENLPPFFFNYQNFEDFLSLHFPTSKAAEWCCICNTRRHFQIPMHSVEYVPLFQQIFSGYEKGTLPAKFNMTEGLENLKINHKDIRLLQGKLNRKCNCENDFVDYLLTLLHKPESVNCT